MLDICEQSIETVYTTHSSQRLKKFLLFCSYLRNNSLRSFSHHSVFFLSLSRTQHLLFSEMDEQLTLAGVVAALEEPPAVLVV